MLLSLKINCYNFKIRFCLCQRDIGHHCTSEGMIIKANFHLILFIYDVDSIYSLLVVTPWFTFENLR